MTNNYLFIDGPDLYEDSTKYYNYGCSPSLLKELINYLENNREEIKKVYCSLYLYNNEVLNDYFKQLVRYDIEVNVISIPLEGYDNNSPKSIIDINTDRPKYIKRKTKYELAENIYNDHIMHEYKNFNFYIFPHMYIRSSRVKPFSRGDMPYSLHIKSLYIEFKNKKNSVIITSSNLAVRDQIKDELMVITEDEKECDNSAKAYFEALIHNSIPIKNFKFNQDWYSYNIQTSDKLQGVSNYYTGPFFKNSQDYMEERLIDLIQGAHNRIYICAQHISAYKYSYDSLFKEEGCIAGWTKKEGFLKSVIDKANEGVKVELLSQTFVDKNGDSHNCRKPANINSFKEFISACNEVENIEYFVNSNMHCKFIVIDDIAIITTCNFTPTQFIYLANVVIEKFDNIPELKYKGIHSEVGQYLIINDKNICNLLIDYFKKISQKKETFHYKREASKDRTQTESLNIEVCPLCGEKVVLKDGKYGEFYGCSGYAKNNCKYTHSI